MTFKNKFMVAVALLLISFATTILILHLLRVVIVFMGVLFALVAILCGVVVLVRNIRWRKVP